MLSDEYEKKLHDYLSKQNSAFSNFAAMDIKKIHEPIEICITSAVYSVFLADLEAQIIWEQ